MFAFELSKEEEMIRESARSFARRRLLPNFRQAEEKGIDPSVLKEYRELGFLELEGPDGSGPLAKALVLEELAAGDAAVALALDGWGPALYAALEMASEGSSWRSRALSGERGSLWVALAREEGIAPWVPAKDGVVVVLDGPKAKVHTKVQWKPARPLALEAAGSSEIVLDGAEEIWESEAGARRALARARTYAAALLVGIARAAYEHAARYAQERVTFGRPIAHHQALAFILVDMATGVDAARLAVWRSAWAIERRIEEERIAAEAFAEAADQALAVTTNAVQALGGHGFMRDHPVEKWYREARALTLMWGGRDIVAEDLGRIIEQGALKKD